MIDLTEHQIRESEHGFGRVFIPSGLWKPEYSTFLRSEGIDGLRLSNSAGWKGSDLQFLSELPFLRSLEIYSWGVRDCSALSSLSELRLVGLECDVRGSVDFGPLGKLEVVLLSWAKAIEGVLQCRRIRNLNVSKWPGVDLMSLTEMEELRELNVSSQKLHSLDGISEFSLLESLDLDRCPKLTSLEGVESCHRMTSFSLSSSKAVVDISVLARCKSLRVVELDSCGAIESLAPLAALHDLERLSFDGDTRVLDGDLSFVESLPKVRELVFAPRGSYNRTRKGLLLER